MSDAEYASLSLEPHSLPSEDIVVKMPNILMPARRILTLSRLFLGMNTWYNFSFVLHWMNHILIHNLHDRHLYFYIFYVNINLIDHIFADKSALASSQHMVLWPIAITCLYILKKIQYSVLWQCFLGCTII